MPSGVEASVRQDTPLAIIDIRGEVTTFAEDVMNRAYEEASSDDIEVIMLNFAGVDYLNSAGIAVVIGIMTEARQADQRVLVTGLTPHYQKVFQMMGLTQYAPLYDTEEAARAALGVP